MEDKRLVATKKDIIIFFVIAISFNIMDIIGVEKIYDFHHFIDIMKLLSFFYLPPILAIFINFIVKFKNIKNEKILKIIKILFNIFIFIYIILMGIIAVILYL